MRILIASDLHGNAEALSVLPVDDYDHLWILGDLVNYGPDPGAVIDFVRKRAALVVRGNHDHAIGYRKDPRCSSPYRAMAAEMGRFTSEALSERDKEYLRSLPLNVSVRFNESRVFLCHAAPSDPLFAYVPPDSEEWPRELQHTASNVLLVGHTHLPFVRELSEGRVVNPGSLGQPKTGKPETCYATWDNGKITLHSAPYAFRETIRKLSGLDLTESVRRSLTTVLETGGSLPD